MPSSLLTFSPLARFHILLPPLPLPPPTMMLSSKVILVTRNVRDCAVSYFHHNLNITPHDFIGDFTSFAKMFKLGLVYNGSYWGHQRSFEKAEGLLRLRCPPNNVKTLY